MEKNSINSKIPKSCPITKKGQQHAGESNAQKMGIVGLIFNGCSSREKKRKEKPGIEKKKPKRKKIPINWTAAGRGEG